MEQSRDFDPSHPVPIIDAIRCTRCGLCIKVCPNHALSSDREGNIIVAQPDACDYVGLCEIACPDGAISRPFVVVWRDEQDSA